ncbi:hypothetical protein D9M69_661450 [compost metagenome]
MHELLERFLGDLDHASPGIAHLAKIVERRITFQQVDFLRNERCEHDLFPRFEPVVRQGRHADHAGGFIKIAVAPVCWLALTEVGFVQVFRV